VEGRLIRIDPLIRWTKDDVRAFMHEHKLPFHPRVARRKPERPLESESSLPSYNY
jgi:3'-phosphoadenosine 5'-phosphosulfate sulfotransferase (PAPS reductase)/FAD synthetase